MFLKTVRETCEDETTGCHKNNHTIDKIADNNFYWIPVTKIIQSLNLKYTF